MVLALHGNEIASERAHPFWMSGSFAHAVKIGLLLSSRKALADLAAKA